MRFHVTYSSAPLSRRGETVDLATLEDLLAFVKETGHEVILSVYDDEESPELEIYDAYRE
jgi:hypothetical protein